MSRILVVDDDPDMRALVATYLKAAGHQVELAEDGQPAGVVACRDGRGPAGFALRQLPAQEFPGFEFLVDPLGPRISQPLHRQHRSPVC